MRPAAQPWGLVSADVGLRPADGGSELVITCWYADSYENGDDTEQPWVLQMVVFDRGRHQPETSGPGPPRRAPRRPSPARYPSDPGADRQSRAATGRGRPCSGGARRADKAVRLNQPYARTPSRAGALSRADQAVRSARKSARDSRALPRRRAGQIGQLGPGVLGVAAHGLPGPLERRRLAQQVERLGVQRVVGDRAVAEDLPQPDGAASTSRRPARRAPAGSARPRAGRCRASCPTRPTRRRCRAGRRRAGRPPRSSRRSRPAPRRARRARRRTWRRTGPTWRSASRSSRRSRAGSARPGRRRAGRPSRRSGRAPAGRRCGPAAGPPRGRGRPRGPRPGRTGSRRPGWPPSWSTGSWRSAPRRTGASSITSSW